jgi:hypothetical protein
MGLPEFKKQQIQERFGIKPDKFKRIISFIDFGNVDYWYELDEQDEDGTLLPSGQRLAINLQKLCDFLRLFSDDTRFYYGHDPANSGSLAFISAAKHIFGRHRVFTKRIQQVRHDLTPVDSISNTRVVQSDDRGDFVLIPKCNFDVEISVDAIRLVDDYDTICLLSSDSDFVSLLRYLRNRNKKIVLIKGGHIQSDLGALLDLKINAQDIKQYITMKKQRPGN